ncbi:GH92 family glycosyl hydrolase [Moheibacter lacus]|uniref:Glycoside hydrolase family 92 protein n=1 Tax=Moheibacter lacus TaxID=2745851 RepID=A0A838ZSI7_9FLAO|nr:GH92 family glycosyl hydrolase [Moheibacter lacus]MBA5629944.1 glycoside hydrolase family 92 protein [Moheibacter lacus]
MRFYFSFILIFLWQFAFSQDEISYVDFVNPLMGTQSSYELSNGNTYPAIGVPWGMNYWSPQTGKMGDGWMYTYTANKIKGFKQTHQPSPWMNDYGQFSIMPTIGLKMTETERESWFSHKAEISKPYYYQVYLADHDITTEITPTERAAQFRFTFPESEDAWIVVDAFDKNSYVKIIPEERKIIGYSTRYSRGNLINFKNYFVIEFDEKIMDFRVWDGKKIQSGKTEITANHSIAAVRFKTKKGEEIHAKVASSFISFEQAELNLKREIGSDDFDETMENAKNVWNEKLSKIKVEGGTEEQMKTFYSCLYRTLLFPNKLYEINEKDKIVHWSPYNGQVLSGKMFAGTGFWDTFRALYPLLNLVYPSINQEMQEGLVNDFKEGGFLPEWSSPGYADIMIGNNSASVVADAFIKNGGEYDIETLWKAVIHGANHEGPVSAVGRKGVGFYNSLGYVPYDVDINENAARTLEYAYADFCIWKLGKVLGKPDSEIEIFKQRSLNYRNLFDKESGWMRGKNQNGSFQTPFNPYKWGDAFTEGNSLHYTWSVFHDVQGLIDLMGGNKKFLNKLDEIFETPPIFDDSYYGQVIHEIREMQIVNMGQYAHGNQPIQHMIYLYNYAGEPYKTQFWAREVMNRLYHSSPDGYCGDEDNGQTSAWYVFSALGFYPVTPGVNQYVIGAPLFKKAILELENGNYFVIQADGNSAENRYINKTWFNGKKYEKNYMNYQDIVNGGIFYVEMKDEPNKNWASAKDDVPYSLSNEK